MTQLLACIRGTGRTQRQSSRFRTFLKDDPAPKEARLGPDTRGNEKVGPMNARFAGVRVATKPKNNTNKKSTLCVNAPFASSRALSRIDIPRPQEAFNREREKKTLERTPLRNQFIATVERPRRLRIRRVFFTLAQLTNCKLD